MRGIDPRCLTSSLRDVAKSLQAQECKASSLEGQFGEGFSHYRRELESVSGEFAGADNVPVSRVVIDHEMAIGAVGIHAHRRAQKRPAVVGQETADTG